jgi:signal peptidase I
MKLLYSRDGGCYRRWVNLLPTLVLPGSAQFLSGRRLEGVGMGLLFAWVEAAWVTLLMHPKTPWSVLDAGPLNLLLLLFWSIVAGDGFRHPLPRMGVRKWGRYLLVCAGVPLAAALAFRAFVGQPFKLPSGAMSPTLKGIRKDAAGEACPGDHVWVSRLAYRAHEPQRGDVVVFRTEGLPLVQPNAYFVKRVVGLPGETVGIEPPYVTVNGRRVTEPPVFRRISGRKGGHCGYACAGRHPSKTFCLSLPSDTVTLGPTEYFVLGDNSTNSFDGRYYGPVQRDSIIGKAVYIYAPADRKRKVE